MFVHCNVCVRFEISTTLFKNGDFQNKNSIVITHSLIQVSIDFQVILKRRLVELILRYYVDGVLSTDARIKSYIDVLPVVKGEPNTYRNVSIVLVN